MANKILSQECHFIKGLDPVADVFNGTVYSKVVSLKNAHACTFVVYIGVGSTGTATLTVQACDDVVPTNTTAVAFKYRVNTSGDTIGAMTNATTSGFTTTAGSSQLYIIEVDADTIASTGYSYCRLKAVEGTNDPVLGGILIILHDLRYPRAVTATQIT